MKCLLWSLVMSVMLAGLANADFLDEFSDSQLDPGWQIGNEDSTHWSLTARPGFLRFITKYSIDDTIWNIFFHKEGLAGNFVATTKVIARPVVQGQCTYIHADNDSLSQTRPRAIMGFGNIAGLGEGLLGWIDANMVLVPYVDTMAYLRIRTNGDTVFTEFSPDNSSWTTLNWAWSPPFPEHQQSGVSAMNYEGFGGTPGTPEINADFDWFHLVALTGVEEPRNAKVEMWNAALRIIPNPFTSFATVPGYEGKSFEVYNISGRWVRTYKGSRVGEGLSPGIYFLKPEGRKTTLIRIVKVR